MKTYLIPRGEHRSTWFPRLHFKGHEFTIKVKFNSSCRYKANVGDEMSKIGGYSFGNNNLIQLMWEWDVEKKKIRVWVFYIHEGRSCYKQIKECGDTDFLVVKFKLIWMLNKRAWSFYVNESHVDWAYCDPVKSKWGFKLFPYFGGQETAPHDIEIDVEL